MSIQCYSVHTSEEYIAWLMPDIDFSCSIFFNKVAFVRLNVTCDCFVDVGSRDAGRDIDSYRHMRRMSRAEAFSHDSHN